MSQSGGASWTSMNENLMALLEAVLTLAASDASAARRPPRPAIKAGGYSEEIFLDLTEEEQDEFSCSICYQMLKETMQCLNHHKFCHSCLLVWSTTGQYANRVRCPVCRCQGYYFRNDELDEKINKKKVKCSMEACRWTGPLKHLGVHRHTNYGGQSRRVSHTLRDDSDEDEEEEDGDGNNVLELPFLGRAPPRLPHRSQSRFSGTGLQARSVMTTAGTATAAMSDASNGNPTIQTTTTRLDGTTSSPVGDGSGILLRPVGGGGGVLLRERRNSNNNTENSIGDPPAPGRLTVRQRVHPIRRSTVNRITVTHTDGNNNVAAPSTTANASETETAPRPSLLSPENLLTSPRQPRPPSAPRPPNLMLRRNLPGLSTAQNHRAPSGRGHNSPPPAAHVIRAPPTFNAATANRSSGHSALNNFHDRLQESRDRLEGLMSTFSGELERSRQEMADFQVERERQRREQLTEVRELGRRLGQVASELRHLLNHRRFRPSESDD